MEKSKWDLFVDGKWTNGLGNDLPHLQNLSLGEFELTLLIPSVSLESYTNSENTRLGKT